MPPSIRSTQRAPLSCTACYARKVKCNREIPCRACISRGVALECRRETVRVRGQVRTGDQPSGNLSYEALLHENTRLSALVAASASSRPTVEDSLRADSYFVDVSEQYEKRLSTSMSQLVQPSQRTVFNDADIIMPSRQCSESFLKYADTWTSWLHCALFCPRFHEEHDQFWHRFSSSSLSTEDPLWLALYFSVLASAILFMEDAEFSGSHPPLQNQEDLLQNWYHSALYLLDKGDFMQKTSTIVVQIVATIGIVATNVGDAWRHANLWTCAVRVAVQLKMGSDRDNVGESTIEREWRRRLWWTLIIVEWLPIAQRVSCIHDVDFDCALPAEMDDEQLLAVQSGIPRKVGHRPRPIQYHIVLSRMAIIVYHFRGKLNMRRWQAAEVAQFVFAADDQLAMLIGELPPHLQNDEPETPATRERDACFPWIPWQKRHITMALLYYRISINRILQSHWLEGSAQYARARSICLSHAVAIVKLSVDGKPGVQRLRPWAISMEVFSATVTLALERQAGSTGYSDVIDAGIDFLKQVESQNMMARQALQILNEIIEH